MPCNVKELEHCLETIPKNGISEIDFIKSLCYFLCVLRKVNGLGDILGWITCRILKDKAPTIDSEIHCMLDRMPNPTSSA